MFPPSTRLLALDQWQCFLPAAGQYAARRNQVEPGHPSVSRLSPALRTRLVLEEELLESLQAAWPFPHVEKLVQEIVWRTYWKGWLELRPSVWTNYLAWLENARPALPQALQREITATEEGRSGVAFMDALVRELKTTGYLHNHARMWFAAFWIHTRKLPWQAGADFFYRHLLDADAASNTLSWRWVAGLQTPGKTYLARLSNLEKYSDPTLLADRTGLDQLSDSRATAVSLPPESNPAPLPLTPDQKIDGAGSPHALWLHWDDLHLESSALASLPSPVAVLAVWPAALVEAWSTAKQAHFRNALHDGLNRAAAFYQCPGVWLESRDPAGALTDWLHQQQITFLTAMRPFTGDWSSIPPALEAAGLALTMLRRPWDRRFFPLATKGFFGFWESVRPQLAMEWQGA